MSGGMDDMDELMPVFFEEGREHVENLNLSLLALERNARDVQSINEAFRASHSLKGMAASMGYAQTTRVTHELESILSGIRERTITLSSELVSVMLVACDVAAQLLEEIETMGGEQTSIDDIVAQLVAAGSVAEQTALTAGDDGDGPPADMIDLAFEAGARVYEVTIAISERSLMPGARAYAALRAFGRSCEIIHCIPDRESLETGTWEGREVFCWVAADIPPEDVAELARGREVTSVDIEEWHRTAPTPLPASPEVAVAPVVQSTDVASATNAADADVVPIRPVTPPVAAAEPAAMQRKTSAVRGRGRSVRVDAARLDELMHGVEELLVRRAHIQTLMQDVERRELVDAVDLLDRAARELQGLVMDVRMVSVDSVLRMIPRLVRDLGNQLGKDVRVNITGRETELDRTVVDVLNDPLVHLVRNALDHGLESPEEREAAGKDRTGTLDIAASTEGGNVVIRVRDDGRGMNPDRIRARAVERGVITAEESRELSDEAAMDLCFAPGFSTRVEANDISGRGVGLDVVRSSVRALGGEVGVESSTTGTVMTVRLPLTLAIRSVLLVRVDGDVYAFHTDRVGQTLDLDLQPIREVAGRPSLMHLGQVIPLIDLGEQLIDIQFDGDDWRARGRNFVVTIESNSGPIGVVVDEVVGQSEVVTRALPSTVRASDLLASSSVLGDGEVAFLIDTMRLAERALPEGTRHVFA